MAVREENWPNGLPAMPCLLMERGKVLRATPSGVVPARRTDGRSVDIFDVIDPLAAEHPRLYLVDLDALAGHDPQLDYVQEVSREVELWVDAGVRNADQAIDVLVAGAARAVLSSSRLRGPSELTRSWSLSTNFVFEIDLADHRLAPIDPEWEVSGPVELARAARAIAPVDLTLGFRTTEPDWATVRAISGLGPTWVGGNVSALSADAAAAAGATGAIYPLGDELVRWADDAGDP